MVRRYQPRNPIDPGSKLPEAKTLGILHYLLAGRPSAWIATRESVSKNTVSAISAKFRRKLRTSAAVRQACFEVFYENRLIDRDVYICLLDLPARVDSTYYADVANCVFRCPSQFSLKAPDWTRFIVGSSKRVLNLRQTQAFFKLAFGDNGFLLRRACASCSAIRRGPISRPEFFGIYSIYLRSRNLRAEDVEDYFLLFAIFLFLHFTAINQFGVSWLNDEITFPDALDWDKLPERYVDRMSALLFELVSYIASFLENDPLE
jgi:hypothetical protein